MTAGVDRLEDALIAPQTLRLLGGRGVVVRPGRKREAAGGRVVLKYGAVATLSRFLGVSEPKLMRVLDVNERTAQRRREQGALTAEESERGARIARGTQRAVEAFGDSAQATAWLGRANRALSGIAPLELLGSDAGAERVTDELGRIEYGELF